MATVPRILMLGPHLQKQGGIATVERVYLDNWDHDRYQIKHIPTVIDGSTAAKIWVFARAMGLFLTNLLWWRPDIVHSHVAWKGSFFRQALFLFLARRAGCQTIFHSNANRFDVFYASGGKTLQRLICYSLEDASLVLAVSPDWRRYYQSIAPNARVVSLYNPVQPPESTGSCPRSTNIILTLGRLEQRKGTYDTLRAVPRILEAHPAAEFWLGGDGEVELVREMLSTKPWKDRVKLLGWVTDGRKDEALQKSCLFLLPSHHEGQPLAILEAMAYRLPIVSTKIGGIPDAVIDGETGYLIDPGDIDALVESVTRLLSDEGLREEMGTAGYQRIMERFEAHHVLDRLYTLYDDLLAGSSKRNHQRSTENETDH